MTLSTIREKYPELYAALDSGNIRPDSENAAPIEPSKFSKFSMRKCTSSIVTRNKQEPPTLKT
jgi:hypothetical protein